MLHRLNRTEYGNAVRDLLAVDVDVTQLLPSDGGDFGFDNVATALPTSPLLLERYLTAALRISELAVGDTGVAPGATVYPISLETTQQDHVPGLPLGTRGGILVHHIFPTDGDYLLSVRLNRTILTDIPESRATKSRRTTSSSWTANRCSPKKSAVPTTTR